MDMTVQISQAIDRAPSRVDYVMQELQKRIDQRLFLPGMRVPSIRKFAAALGVSKSTVVEAYDRLVADGVLEARKSSGFYVGGHLQPLTLSKLSPQVDRVIDPLWVSRQSLDANEGALKPGCGWLPSDWMPQEALRRAIRSLAKADPSVLTEYGTPLGFMRLREFLSHRMARQNIAAHVDQIILTESGTQSIDLLCRFFIEPGDTVLVDDPCYFNFQALLKAHRAKVVSVPYTPTGPDPERFEQVVKEHQPRIYITNSGVHNPTGAVLSPSIAHQVLKIAEQSDMVIIEDDIFADLGAASTPRLAAFDGLSRVIHIGSFSKTLSAAARCGFIAARQEWIEGLVDLKIATSFGGNPLAAELSWRVLKDGSYRKYIDNLRERLSTARHETLNRLTEIGIVPLFQPSAGMYIWCMLPNNLDAGEVAHKALFDDIVLAPGNVFSPTGTATSFLRFNVAQSQSLKIFNTLGSIISAN